VTNAISYSPKNTVLNAIRAGWLCWIGLWMPRTTLEQQDLQSGMRPFRIRWGWVLLLAVILVLMMGEYGPAASAIAALPQQ